MHSSISIGCECGGPQHGGIPRLKVELYRALEKYVKSTYCDEIDEYSPVFRVDGSLCTYGAEGVHRVRFAKKERYITADIHIPESVWRPKSETELRHYLGSALRSTIETFVTRLKKDGISIAESSLFAEIDAAIYDFTVGS